VPDGGKRRSAGQVILGFADARYAPSRTSACALCRVLTFTNSLKTAGTTQHAICAFTVSLTYVKYYQSVTGRRSGLKFVGPKGLWGFASLSRHQISEIPRCDRDFGRRRSLRSQLRSVGSESSKEVRSGWNRSMGTTGQNQQSIRAIREEADKTERALKEILSG
jgi:hypothetical protein